jgi:hypothetical protein
MRIDPVNNTVDFTHGSHPYPYNYLVMRLPSGVELQSANTDYGPCDTSNLPTLVCSLTDLTAWLKRLML